jgi:gluconokinase
MNSNPLVWVITGVSGSGKTTIGRRLSQQLNCDFLEGDRRHPFSNITKMIEQKPLQDEDRLPWLLNIEDDIQRAIAQNREIVITCSALKASYRKQLTSLGQVQLVWLKVAASILEQRVKNRPEHYMKSEMLDSQMAAAESITPEENIITVNGNFSTDTVVDKLMEKAVQLYPSIKKPWWQRCSEALND